MEWWKTHGFNVLESFHAWEFTLQLLIALLKERPWAICSRCSLKKSDHERIAFVALCKRVMRAICSQSLSKREWREWFARFFCTFALSLSKTSNLLEQNSMFAPCFWCFSLLSPFLWPRANRSRHSSPRCSFLKSNGSDSLTVALLKERDGFTLGKERIAIWLFCSQGTSNSH